MIYHIYIRLVFRGSMEYSISNKQQKKKSPKDGNSDSQFSLCVDNGLWN